MKSVLSIALAAAAVAAVADLSLPDLCHCPSSTKCGCCAGLHLNDSIIHINDTACIEMAYDKGTTDIDLSITLNGDQIYDDKINLKDYEKECVGIPYIKKEAEICADFSKVVLNTSFVGACAGLELDVLREKILSIDLGCFHFTP